MSRIHAPSLPWRDLLLALLVMAVWGTNFVVIKLALGTLPPLLFAALRFSLVALPGLFFVKRPKVSWSNLAAYGLLIGAGQFGLLFVAMKSDISPGLASLIIQTQVVFTIGLAIALDREKIRLHQGFAVALAAAGVAVIAMRGGGAATPLGLALVLGAALSWAGGNIVARRNGPINMLAYVIWAAPFSVPPLFLLSLWLDGWPAIEAGLIRADAGVWAAVAWQSAGNTMFGYALWAWLLARHATASIAPMALLVPIFGMGASAFILAEPLQSWKLVAAGLVLSGLGLNVFWPKRVTSRLSEQP